MEAAGRKGEGGVRDQGVVRGIKGGEYVDFMPLIYQPCDHAASVPLHCI